MKRHLSTVVFVLSAWVAGAMASEQSVAPLRGEREVLARMTQELDFLKTMADEAERQSHDSGRLRFQYGWFRRDLEHIKQGILDYLHGPNSAPVRVKPLRGDYQQ